MKEQNGLDLMERDIRRQSRVIGEGRQGLRAAADDAAARIGTDHARAYLVGCGDSLDDGIAARYVWERLAPVPVEAVPAMTFSTRIVDAAPRGSLVVALSQSGKVSRVIEAVRAARARGLKTVTITAFPNSPLAAEPSDATWIMEFEKLGSIPGTTSHLVGALALYELGCALAADAGQASRIRSEIDLAADLCAKVVDIAWPLAEAHAATLERDAPVLAIGYGPALSSAKFTIRKILETTQLVALWQETEEYAHDEYSLVDRRFKVLQFAPPDRGLTRSREIAGYLRRLQSHLAVVTDGDAVEMFTSSADLVYALPSMPASLAPLLYAVPGQILSVLGARRLGGSLYGMAEQVHREDGDPQIYESDIVVPPASGAST